MGRRPYDPLYPIVFLDVETTGLEPSRHRILELALVRRERDGSQRVWSSKLRVSAEDIAAASAKALEVNGYADAPQAWEDAPTFREAWPAMAPFLDRVRTVVGHNVGFDDAFLRAELHRLAAAIQTDLEADDGIEPGSLRERVAELRSVARLVPGGMRWRRIDTVALATEHLVPAGLRYVSLDSIRRWLGWRTIGAHTALVDAMQTADLFDLCWRMPTWRRWALRARGWIRSLNRSVGVLRLTRASVEPPPPANATR